MRGTTGGRRGLLAVRLAFVVAGLLLAFFAVRVARERTADLAALRQVIAATGLGARRPEAVAALLEDPDPAHDRLDATSVRCAWGHAPRGIPASSCPPDQRVVGSLIRVRN